MKVIMFQPQFAPLVEAGTKTQTVRPARRKAIKPGDLLSLRAWTGKPYRSKQRVLLEAQCTAVARISINQRRVGRGLSVVQQEISLDGLSLVGREIDWFCKDDGFGSSVELFQWFEREHGLPFRGVLIKWKSTKEN